jgi:hypothetical protein
MVSTPSYRPLIIGNAGDWSTVLASLRQQAITLYLDVSKQSLPPPGTVDYAFSLGGGQGTGENVFSTFADLVSEKYRFTQILNAVVKTNAEDINAVVTMSGCCPSSSSAAISPALLFAMHEHPFFRDKLKIALVTTELSKITSLERAYKAFTTLLIIQDLADILILVDNDSLGYPTEDLKLNPYKPVNDTITQFLEDFFAQDRRPTTSTSLKKKIWEFYRFRDEFKTPEWTEQEVKETISGKFLDYGQDLPTLIPDESNKWACFGVAHPKKEVMNAFDMVERCLTTLSAPVSLPLYGEVGAAVLLHKLPYFPDLDSVLRKKFASELLTRSFVYNPERHCRYGIVFLGLGINWINFPVLTELLDKAVIYAEQKADEKIPDLLRETEKKISQEKYEERKKIHAEAFEKEIDRILSKTARKRREESESYLLNTLDETTRQRIRKVLEQKKGNNLSQIFEKKSGSPNPFWVILQEVYEV